MYCKAHLTGDFPYNSWQGAQVVSSDDDDYGAGGSDEDVSDY